MYKIKVTKAKGKISVVLLKRYWFFWYKEVEHTNTTKELIGCSIVSNYMQKYDVKPGNIIDDTNILIK